MKKIVALALLLIMLIPTVLLTACADPLQDKMDELNDVFNKLGDTYYLTYEAAVFSDALSDAGVKEKLNQWKKDIKAAKNAKAAYEQYTEEELQSYIDQWNQLLSDMNEMYDQYKAEILAAKEEAKKIAG